MNARICHFNLSYYMEYKRIILIIILETFSTRGFNFEGSTLLPAIPNMVILHTLSTSYLGCPKTSQNDCFPENGMGTRRNAIYI
jgi:hypothetical protein